MSKQERDEGVEKVRRTLYAELSVGDISDEEYSLANSSAPIPEDPKSAAARLRARYRWNAIDWQIGEVMRWLQQQGLNCEPEKFDRKKFDEFFKLKFDAALSSRDIRRSAIKKRLDAGDRPGRPGHIDWKPFYDAIRKTTGLHFDDKTIDRDAREMMPPLGK
jgi:hypothetical protein